MEDLIRVVVLYYYAISRRARGSNIFDRLPPVKEGKTPNAMLDSDEGARLQREGTRQRKKDNPTTHADITGADAGDLVGTILEQLCSANPNNTISDGSPTRHPVIYTQPRYEMTTLLRVFIFESDIDLGRRTASFMGHKDNSGPQRQQRATLLTAGTREMDCLYIIWPLY